MLGPNKHISHLMQSNSGSQSHIDHDDVVARFNKSYPDIDPKAHHSSLLLEIFTDSFQKFGGGPSRRILLFY